MEILDENPDLFVLNKWIMNRLGLECNHHLTVRTLSSFVTARKMGDLDQKLE